MMTFHSRKILEQMKNKARQDNLPFGILLIGILLLLIVVFEQNRTIRNLQTQLDAGKPIVIYRVDNIGAEMVGKVTSKEIIKNKYVIVAGEYGRFLVTKEIFDSVEIGDDLPEILKGVSK